MEHLHKAPFTLQQPPQLKLTKQKGDKLSENANPIEASNEARNAQAPTPGNVANNSHGPNVIHGHPPILVAMLHSVSDSSQRPQTPAPEARQSNIGPNDSATNFHKPQTSTAQYKSQCCPLNFVTRDAAIRHENCCIAQKFQNEPVPRKPRNSGSAIKRDLELKFDAFSIDAEQLISAASCLVRMQIIANKAHVCQSSGAAKNASISETKSTADVIKPTCRQCEVEAGHEVQNAILEKMGRMMSAFDKLEKYFIAYGPDGTGGNPSEVPVSGAAMSEPSSSLHHLPASSSNLNSQVKSEYIPGRAWWAPPVNFYIEDDAGSFEVVSADAHSFEVVSADGGEGESSGGKNAN